MSRKKMGPNDDIEVKLDVDLSSEIKDLDAIIKKIEQMGNNISKTSFIDSGITKEIANLTADLQVQVQNALKNAMVDGFKDLPKYLKEVEKKYLENLQITEKGTTKITRGGKTETKSYKNTRPNPTAQKILEAKRVHGDDKWLENYEKAEIERAQRTQKLKEQTMAEEERMLKQQKVAQEKIEKALRAEIKAAKEAGQKQLKIDSRRIVSSYNKGYATRMGIELIPKTANELLTDSVTKRQQRARDFYNKNTKNQYALENNTLDYSKMTEEQLKQNVIKDRSKTHLVAQKRKSFKPDEETGWDYIFDSYGIYGSRAKDLGLEGKVLADFGQHYKNAIDGIEKSKTDPKLKAVFEKRAQEILEVVVEAFNNMEGPIADLFQNQVWEKENTTFTERYKGLTDDAAWDPTINPYTAKTAYKYKGPLFDRLRSQNLIERPLEFVETYDDSIEMGAKDDTSYFKDVIKNYKTSLEDNQNRETIANEIKAQMSNFFKEIDLSNKEETIQLVKDIFSSLEDFEDGNYVNKKIPNYSTIASRLNPEETPETVEGMVESVKFDLPHLAKQALLEVLEKKVTGNTNQSELLTAQELIQKYSSKGTKINTDTISSPAQDFAKSVNRFARIYTYSGTVDKAVEEYAKKVGRAKEEILEEIFNEDNTMKTLYEESKKIKDTFDEAGGLKNIDFAYNKVMGISSRELEDIDRQKKDSGAKDDSRTRIAWNNALEEQLTLKKPIWQEEYQKGMSLLPYGAHLGNIKEGIEKAQNRAQKLKDLRDSGAEGIDLEQINKELEVIAQDLEELTEVQKTEEKEKIKKVTPETIRKRRKKGIGINEFYDADSKRRIANNPDVKKIEEVTEREKEEKRKATLKGEVQEEQKIAQEKQKTEEAIKKEEKAIEEANKDFEEHIEKVEQAAEAEKAKYVISGELSKELDKEAEKIEESTKAYEEHAKIVAKPINVEAHLNDKEHYYLDKDTGEKVQSVTQYRAKLLGKSNEQYLKDRDMFKKVIESTSIGNVLNAQSLGMNEMDFEFFKADFASSKRGTLVHRAVELLEKEGANTLEELSQEAQKELAEGVEDLTKELAKLGIDKDYINLPDYAQNYRALLDKMGITHAQASELSLGMNLGGEKVAGTMDQLWTLGKGSSLITDIKTTKKMHGFDETFQLSLLKEILIANLDNANLDESVRNIFEGIDPQKIETAIIHLIDGKAEKIDFGSLNTETLLNLLQRANKGEVLTEDEQRAYSRQSQIGKTTIEGAGSGTISTMKRSPLFEKIRTLVVEIDAMEKLLEDPSLSSTTKTELTDELTKTKNALDFLKNGKDENGKALGYEISEKDLARLDKYTDKYKKTTQYAMETNNAIQKRASKLKEEEAEQNRIKAIVDDVNNLMGHTTREITLQGQEAKEVSEFFNAIEDGKEVIYKKVSFVDMNGNPIGDSSYQKATKAEANPSKMFSGAFDPKNMHASMSLQDTGIKSYLDYVGKLNSQQVEVAKTERKLEDVGLSRAEKAALKENLAIQKATEQSIYNQKLGLQGNVLTYQDQNGALKSIILSDEKIAMLNKKIAELAGKQQVALSKAKNARLESETFFGKVALGFQNSLRNLIDYTAAYTVIGWIKQSYAEFIQVTKDLDKSLVDLQIATGNTREETRKLLQEYSKMGRDIGRTTTEIAQASNDWLRAGYEGAEAAQLTRASMYLSTLGMLDSAQATEYLISTLKGWKLGAEDVMNVVDKLVVVDMSAALSAGDLALAMSRANVSAQLAGSSMDNFIGYVTTVADVSQKSAESVGESMKTMYARWGNVKVGKWQPGEGEEDELGEYEGLNDIETILNKVNIRYRDSANELRNYDEVMDEIGKKWKSFDQVTKNALASAIAGVRQRENALILFENWDQVTKYAEIAAVATGTATEKMKAYDDSIEASQKRIIAGFESFVNGKNAQNLIKFINAELATMMEMLDQILFAAGAFLMLWQAPTILKVTGQLALNFAKMGQNVNKLLQGDFKGTIGKRFDGTNKSLNEDYDYLFNDGEKSSTKPEDTFKTGVKTATETWESGVEESVQKVKGAVDEIINKDKAHEESERAEEKAHNDTERQKDTSANTAENAQNINTAGTEAKIEIDAAIQEANIERGSGATGNTTVVPPTNTKLSSTTRNTIIGGIGSMVGTTIGASGGGNIGYAIGGEKGELVGSAIGGAGTMIGGAALGAKLGATFGGVLAGPIGAAVGTVIVGGVTAIVGGITGGAKKAKEEAAKKLAQEAVSLREELANALTAEAKLTSTSFQSRFTELSKGVDEYGRNVSLSDTDYAEYQESINTILEATPNLVKAYDAEGNALIDRNTILQESINLLKEETKEKRNSLYTPEQIQNTFKTQYDATYNDDSSPTKKLKDLKKEIKDLNFDPDNFSYTGIDETFNDFVTTGRTRKGSAKEVLNIEAIANNYGKFKQLVESTAKTNSNGEVEYEFDNETLAKIERAVTEYRRLNKEVKQTNKDLEASKKGLSSYLTGYIDTLDGAEKLTDGERLFLSNFASSFTLPEGLSDEEVEEYADDVSFQIKDAFDRIQTDSVFANLVEELFSLDNEDIKVKDLDKKREEFIRKIEELFPDLAADILVQLNLVVTDKDGNPIDANGNIIPQNENYVNVRNDVANLSQQNRQELEKINKEVNSSTGGDWNKKVKELRQKAIDLGITGITEDTDATEVATMINRALSGSDYVLKTTQTDLEEKRDKSKAFSKNLANVNLDELTEGEQKFFNNNFVRLAIKPYADTDAFKKELKELQKTTNSWGDEIQIEGINNAIEDIGSFKDAIADFQDNGYLGAESIEKLRALGTEYGLSADKMNEALMGKSGKWELTKENINKFVSTLGTAIIAQEDFNEETLLVLDSEMKAQGVVGTLSAGYGALAQQLILNGKAKFNTTTNTLEATDALDTETQALLNNISASGVLSGNLTQLSTVSSVFSMTTAQTELDKFKDTALGTATALMAVVNSLRALSDDDEETFRQLVRDVNLADEPGEWNETTSILRDFMVEKGIAGITSETSNKDVALMGYNALRNLDAQDEWFEIISNLINSNGNIGSESKDKSRIKLDYLKNLDSLIDKEYEAMLAKDEDRDTYYFTKKRASLEGIGQELQNVYANIGAKALSKDYTIDDKKAELADIEAEIIENEKALRNLNDEEAQDNIDREKERLDLINDTTRATVEQREASKRKILQLNQFLLSTADTEEEVLQRTKAVTDAFRDWITVFKEEELQKISDEIFDGAITDIDTLLSRTKSIKDTIKQEGGSQADISMLLGIDEEGLDILLERLESGKDLLGDKDFVGQYNNLVQQREVLLAKINALKDNEKDSSKEILEIEKQLKQLEEDRKSIVSAYQSEINRYYDRQIEDIEIERDALNWRVKQEEAMLSVMEKRFETSNGLIEAQKDINKELRSSRLLAQYLDQETRKLVFNEADYSKLSNVIKKLQKDTEKIGKEYYEDLLDLSEETIYLEEYITNEYERRLEMKEKELEIAKAELDLTKKQQELDNILAEKNVRMLINGEWRQVANQENVRNALEAMEDAEAELEKLRREQEQEQMKNEAEAHIDSLKKKQDAYDEEIRQIQVFTRELDRAFEDYLDPIMGIGHLVEGLNRTTMPDFITAVEDLETDGVDHFKTVLEEVGEALERMVDIDTPPEDGGDDEGSSDEGLTEEEEILAKIEEEINYLNQLKDDNRAYDSSGKELDYEDQSALYQWANEELWMFETALKALEEGDMATYESFVSRLDAGNAKLLNKYKEVLGEMETLNDTATFALRNQNSTINAIEDTEEGVNAASEAELAKLDEIRGDIQDIETEAKEEEEEEVKSYRSYSSKSYSSGSSYVSTGVGEFTGQKTETGETLGEAATTSGGDQVYITDSGKQYVPGLGYVGTVNKNANGTTNFEGGLSLVGEEGAELGVFPKGTGIIPNSITETLWAFGENPMDFLRRAYSNISALSDYKFALPQINGNISNTNQNITIEKVELNNVTDGNNFLPELNAYLRRTTKVTDNK